jgi:hypothetical protein
MTACHYKGATARDPRFRRAHYARCSIAERGAAGKKSPGATIRRHLELRRELGVPCCEVQKRAREAEGAWVRLMSRG